MSVPSECSFLAVIFIPIPLPEQVLQTFYCTQLFYRIVILTISGMGMGMNVTAQCRCAGQAEEPGGPGHRDSARAADDCGGPNTQRCTSA